MKFHGSLKSGFNFSFASNSSTDVTLDNPPEKFFEGGAVFFPTKETLSMFPGFAALYDNVSIQLDETYAIPSSVLSAHGYGESFPKYPSGTEAEMMLDRRVLVVRVK